ncbi:hypothetical protein BYT27DRAFT_7257651 [Phlegmacium glaucopus]|nr:hypothetical protein BYT27DRAFT_7257651 [Phlegmacium glaucopus]
MAMDSLTFETYSTYSDSSTPRTPSPTEMLQIHHKIYSPDVVDQPGVRNIFVDDNDYSFNKGSLLHELYEQEIPPEYQQSADIQHSENVNWSQPHHRPSEYAIIRRATFPYVRHDRDNIPPQHYPPFMQQQQQHHYNNHYSSRQDPLYNEPESYMTSSPQASYNDFDDSSNIKLEDTTPLMVPQQSNFYTSPPSSAHPIPMPYLPPTNNLPVQHTDDAASKETQYLRRRCFNCHTTEPPSWRRSTLNPGKIVCNKCGLYERTHLRARPLRFDELRSGCKSRKQSKASTSPKQSKLAMIKKEPREFGLDRRSSVSSSSSVHSGSGASDWDDNVSLYSAGSAPPTSFNSPIAHNYPLSRDSLSPPQDGGIRLPNNPLSDVASLRHPSNISQSIPLKSHTSPGGYYSSPSLPELNIVPQAQTYFPHSQNSTSSEATLWAEPTEMNSSRLASSPTVSS